MRMMRMLLLLMMMMIDIDIYIYMCMFRAIIVDKLMIIIEVDRNSVDNKYSKGKMELLKIIE
jgi:hypothetical protein